MGNDLAKADAVNTALANQRGRAAHDAVTGRLLLAASREVRRASMRTAYLGAMTVVIGVCYRRRTSMTVVIGWQAIWRRQR